MRICVITLGCPKNVVDSETMTGRLISSNKIQVVDDAAIADVIIINTCAFLLSAREEAIETILQATQLKESGPCTHLFVVGCLPQKYRSELEREIPEVDGFFDQLDFNHVANAIAASIKIEHTYQAGRSLSTPRHYAYLKIAEGCDNRCSYCTIPSIKGRFQSRPKHALLSEARQLVDNGTRELILIAQDTTSYGADFPQPESLYSLMSELVSIESLQWLRLMYTHPAHWDERLIDMLHHPKVCRYLEMPIQHAADPVLRKMGRTVTNQQMRAIFKHVRNEIPDIVLRTTAIVGFPGETRADFNELVKFVQDIEFDRLGVFLYSAEEDTPAFTYDNQVDDAEKEERYQELMEIQRSIAERRHRKLIGQSVNVLIDEYDDERECFIGRSQGECPEIDPQILIEDNVVPGDFYTTRIEAADAYELHGTIDGA